MSIRAAYKSLKSRLFHFLKLAFEHWPQDDNLEPLVDVWLTYITPWKAVGSCFSDDWGLFVKDNFVYYTVLLQLFLRRSRSFSFITSIRPIKEVSDTSSLPRKSPGLGPIRPQTGNSAHRHLESIEKVMQVFSDSGLLDLLSVLEIALSSLDTFSGSIGLGDGASPHLGVRSPTSQRQSVVSMNRQSFASSGPDAMHIYQNCGPFLRAHIRQFEKNDVTYQPVFIGDVTNAGAAHATENLLNAQKLAIALVGISDRLSYYRSKALSYEPSSRGGSVPSTPVMSGPSNMGLSGGRVSEVADRLSLRASTISGPPVPRKSETLPQGTNEASESFLVASARWLIKSIHSMVDSSLSAQSVTSHKLKRHQIDQLEADIKRIEQIVYQIARIWKLDVELDILSQVDSQSGGGAMGSGDANAMQDEEGTVKVVAPGVFAPEVQASNTLRLTRRGREQVKLGLRKSAKEDVPIVKSNRAQRIYYTDESPLLVYLLMMLAGHLEQLVKALICI